jgi:hypothetical protein
MGSRTEQPYHPHSTKEEVRLAVNSESDLVEFATDQLKYHGWGVSTEIKPDRSDYRIDILATHEKLGWVGIEAKYGGDSTEMFAEAFQQVTEQYWDKKFAGRPVLLWAVLIWDRGVNWIISENNFLSFTHNYGLGLFRGHHFNQIRYKWSSPMLSVPVSNKNWNRRGSVTEIRDYVKKKRNKTKLSKTRKNADWA